MEKKDLNDMRIVDDIGGVFQRPGFNSRSYTAKEMVTIGLLDKFKIFSQLDGKELKLKNDGRCKYYIIEDGTVFKYNEDGFRFHRLNLNDFVWEYDQTLASIYYDTYLRYQELPYFEDYYPNIEDLDLSDGRQR